MRPPHPAACLLGALLLAGCPADDGETAPTGRPPLPGGASSGGGGQPGEDLALPGAGDGEESLGRSWQEAVDHVRDWPTSLTRVMKDDAAREELLGPLEGPELERLALLFRYLPVGLRPERPATLEKALRLHLSQHPSIDAAAFADDPTRLVLAVGLLDPTFLYTQPVVSTGSGWVSLQGALKKGADPAVSAIGEDLLAGVRAARAGDWAAAAPRYRAAALALGRRAGGQGLASVEGLAEAGEPAELEAALAAWAESLGAVKAPKPR